MNETPETLRAEAKYYRSRDDFGDEAIANRMDAHAAAWEAERNHKAVMDRMLVDALDTVTGLRGRLVELEADHDALRAAIFDDKERQFPLRPAHFAAWADAIEKQQGYKGSELSCLLRRLASLPPEEETGDTQGDASPEGHHG